MHTRFLISDNRPVFSYYTSLDPSFNHIFVKFGVDTITLHSSSSAGYAVGNWTISGTIADNKVNYEFTMMDGNHGNFVGTYNGKDMLVGVLKVKGYPISFQLREEKMRNE